MSELHAMADRWEADAAFIETSQSGTRPRRAVAAEALRSCASDLRAVLTVDSLARSVLSARSQTPRWKGLARATEPTPWDRTMAKRILASLDAAPEPSWSTDNDGYVVAPLENRGTLDVG